MQFCALLRPTHRVKVTLMPPGSSVMHEWHQHSRDHYFLLWIIIFCLVNTVLQFWFPNLQPCIVFCSTNPTKPVFTSADSAAGLVGGIGTACQVAIFYQVHCLCVTSTHGNGKVLSIISISQLFALQLNWCLSTLENFFRLVYVSAEWGNRNCSHSFCWDFAVYQGKGEEGNVEKKLRLMPTMKALGRYWDGLV